MAACHFTHQPALIHQSVRRVVFAGGPGAGKSALLRDLQRHGYPVAADSSRSIIQFRRSQSLSARPPALEFARAILGQDIQQYIEHSTSTGIVFFERGVVDALGMLHEIGGLPEGELHALLSAHEYDRRVFFFPPWEAIYANDAERDQSFEESVNIAQRTWDWYGRCGYELVEVPRVSIAERRAHVLRVLDDAVKPAA